MPEYGVWLEDDREPKHTQFVWRGTARDRRNALDAARSAWEQKYGARPENSVCYVEEIQPGDAGFGHA